MQKSTDKFGFYGRGSSGPEGTAGPGSAGAARSDSLNGVESAPGGDQVVRIAGSPAAVASPRRCVGSSEELD